jgi:deazaflavin-dependent oxidoreductase (nitroreductase family)
MYQIANPILALLLRSPLHGLMSARLMLLSFTGRKSGRRYRIPVGYVQDGTSLLLTTKAGWQKNFRSETPVRVRLRGAERAGTGVVATDEEQVWQDFRRLFTREPGLASFIGIGMDASGEPVRADVERARSNGYVVVRIALR